MKNWLLFLTLIIFTQQVSPGQKFSLAGGTIRAVVIGISDYQDDRIVDLKYAHRDARFFREFLQSETGGALDETQIKMLTNREATSGRIIAALDWLKTESKKGDRAIIYFSGHGDVERKTEMQKGFLLAYDAPAFSYSSGGVVSVEGLKKTIFELTGKEVQVIMVTDACRAGNLAGSRFSGAQLSNAALAEQFTNEIKIMSCQPNEYSLEGAEWGGGRGLFSYHLLDGLYGLADADNNLQVNLREARNYLEENLLRDADPHPQNPIVKGNLFSRLTFVREEVLSALKRRKQEENIFFGGSDRKLGEDGLLANADTSIQQLYQAFLLALEEGRLMADDGQSANDYYNLLIREDSIQPLHASMTRNLAAALQDEAQQAINDYLSSERFAVEFMRQSDLLKFYKYPDYLERAADLLGEDHFAYNSLKAREYYFRARRIMLEGLTGTTTLSPAIRSRFFCNYCEEGLEYDPLASYLYAMLGHGNCGDQRIENYQRVLELSPSWLQAYLWLAEEEERAGRLDSAENLVVRLLNFDSTYVLAYKYHSKLKTRSGRYEEAVTLGEKALQLDTSYLDPWYNYWLGAAYLLTHEFGKFRTYRNNQAGELESRDSVERSIRGNAFFNELADYHFYAGDLKAATDLYRGSLSRTSDPELAERSHWGLGWIALMEDRPQEALGEFSNTDPVDAVLGQGLTYLKTGQQDLADSLLLIYLNARKDSLNQQIWGYRAVILEGNSIIAIQPALAAEVAYLYQLAEQIYPDEPFLLYNSGVIFRDQVQDYKRAIVFFERVIQLDPQFAKAYYAMASAYAYSNRPKKALDKLEQALQKGFEELEKINADPAWTKLQGRKKFQALMRQYF